MAQLRKLKTNDEQYPIYSFQLPRHDKKLICNKLYLGALNKLLKSMRMKQLYTSLIRFKINYFRVITYQHSRRVGLFDSRGTNVLRVSTGNFKSFQMFLEFCAFPKFYYFRLISV